MLKMLWRLLRSHLRPYKRELWLVVLFQGCQTIATLTLPALNANIIDKGVVPGDTGYVMRVGGVMLGISLLQVLAQIVAVYFGAQTAMAVGRDVRAPHPGLRAQNQRHQCHHLHHARRAAVCRCCRN